MARTAKLKTTKKLWEEIRSRWDYPWGSWAFRFHLYIIVIACGGLGVWASLLQCWFSSNVGINDVGLSLYTYFPGLVAVPVFELINREDKPYLRTFSLCVGILSGFIFLFCVFTQGWVRLIGGVVGTLCSLGFWCIANARSEWVRDDEETDPPDAATGGPDTEQLAGGKKKFKGMTTNE